MTFSKCWSVLLLWVAASLAAEQSHISIDAFVPDAAVSVSISVGEFVGGGPVPAAPGTSVTTRTFNAGQYLVVGPTTAGAVLTLGYWVQSVSGTFSTFLMDSTNYAAFQAGQQFSYYTAYSFVTVTSAYLASQSFTAPNTLYIVLTPWPMTNAVTVNYNIGFFQGTCLVSGGCQNQGVCQGGGVCACTPSWTGAKCTEPVCSPDCGSHGSCTAPNTCTCQSGWIGVTCETPVCTNPCQNGGTCTSPNTCLCTSQWTGDTCTIPVCNPVCNSHQTCISPNTCGCQSGWNGTGCQTPICTNACQNGGVCTAPDTCTCQNGWTGNTCQTPICTNACQNGGTCMAPNHCNCTAQWTGPTCTTPVCSPNCANGGTCIAPNTCQCPPAWTGASCTISACSIQCQNGGTCVGANMCSCPSGWRGSDCTTAVCTLPCLNGGTCSAPGVCTCPPGVSGSQCATVTITEDVWFATNCDGAPKRRNYVLDTCYSSSGTSLLFKYNWPTGQIRSVSYLGSTCSGLKSEDLFSNDVCSEYLTTWRVKYNFPPPIPTCSNSCQHGGTCVAPEQCACASGWEGSACQIPICIPACTNGGTCSAPNTCQCAPGWTGTTCGTPVCSVVCLNGGTCSAPNTCQCSSQWNSPDCSVPVCRGGCQNGGTCSAPNTCSCAPNYSGSQCGTFTPRPHSIDVQYGSQITLAAACGSVVNWGTYTLVDGQENTFEGAQSRMQYTYDAASYSILSRCVSTSPGMCANSSTITAWYVPRVPLPLNGTAFVVYQSITAAPTSCYYEAFRATSSPSPNDSGNSSPGLLTPVLITVSGVICIAGIAVCWCRRRNKRDSSGGAAVLAPYQLDQSKPIVVVPSGYDPLVATPSHAPVSGHTVYGALHA